MNHFKPNSFAQVSIDMFNECVSRKNSLISFFRLPTKRYNNILFFLLVNNNSHYTFGKNHVSIERKLRDYNHLVFILNAYFIIKNNIILLSIKFINTYFISNHLNK